MRSRDARLRRKKLKNYAKCWMSTKGAGDERPDELDFPKRDARFGMGSIALPVGGNGTCGSGCVGNGALPPHIGAIFGWRRDPGAHADRSVGDISLLFATTLGGRPNCEFVAARRGGLACRKERRGAGCQFSAIARCNSVAGASVASWGGFLQ